MVNRDGMLGMRDWERYPRNVVISGVLVTTGQVLGGRTLVSSHMSLLEKMRVMSAWVYIVQCSLGGCCLLSVSQDVPTVHIRSSLSPAHRSPGPLPSPLTPHNNHTLTALTASNRWTHSPDLLMIILNINIVYSL